MPGNGIDDACDAATPDCIDADGDTYSVTGGACGPIDYAEDIARLLALEAETA